MSNTVLLVDDDKNILDGLKRALRKENYEVLCAGSAEQAMETLNSQTIDVVISDQDMPGRKGTDFLNLVVLKFPDTIRFMLTGQATLEVAVEAINKGAINRFFTKPCNTSELAVSIRQALQQRELMIHARRLLDKTQSQANIIQHLERESPGITKVNRDLTGAIIVPEKSHEKLNELINDIKDINNILEEQ